MRLMDRIARKSHRTVGTMLSFQTNRQCPMCGWKGFQFLPAKPGPFFRFDAMCPQCDSAERHRLAYVMLAERLKSRVGKLLHFAPERCVQQWLSSTCDEYHTADLSAPNVMHHIDITAMPFDAASFDRIWCSHVLEHVPDDRKAMREIARVLKPGGVAIIQVPLWGEVTREEVLATPEERVMQYFQEDHVRRYGADIRARLEEAGLDVEVLKTDMLDLDVVLRHGLNDMASNDIFLATRVG
jgi:SAM-dependent methyltransferase